MTRRVVRSRWVRGGCSLIFLGALTYAVWPVSLGGAANFVVVRGHSMEGTYHQGDLLYARNDQSFAPGDVAVYRIPKGIPGAGALVVHRIIRRLPNGHYLMQGDNKQAPDDVTPSRRDIVATPVLDLGGWPTRGLVLAPIVFSLIVGIAVMIALWPERTFALDDVEPSGDEDANEANIDEGDEPGSSRRRFAVRGVGASPRPVTVIDDSELESAAAQDERSR